MPSKRMRTRRAWRSAEGRDGRKRRPDGRRADADGELRAGAAGEVRADARDARGNGAADTNGAETAEGRAGRADGRGETWIGGVTPAVVQDAPRTGNGGDANGRAAVPSRGEPRTRAGSHRSKTNGRTSAVDGVSALTPEQIKRIEQRLLQERELALRTLVGTRTDIQRHPISDMRKEEMDIHLAERHSEFLALIDSALRRLRESPADFHLSVVSGRPIPFERLEMVPWTRRLTSEMGLPARW